MSKRKREDVDDDLEPENANLSRRLAAKEEQIQLLEKQLQVADEQNQKLEKQLEVAVVQNQKLEKQFEVADVQNQKLEKQLEVAEHQNSAGFAGGESFLDTEATPHLLNKAVERVDTTSRNFTKLVMSALKTGGVDCTAVAKVLKKTVKFERDAHTKYLYQALVCKALFTGFESESYNVEGNAPVNLDPEQSRTEHFQRYKQLLLLENPEELVFEDATDNDFRRFCNKKREDLIVVLSRTGILGVDDVGALMFGQVFAPGGIRRHEFKGGQSQAKLTSNFAKFALSVFLVHKLAFSLHPIARIFQVQDAVEFTSVYMDPVVSSADSEEDDNTTPVSWNVGFMVVPGFHVNRIVVHSRVYTVKRA